MTIPMFRTKEARKKYNSWTPIIKKAIRDGVPKSTIAKIIHFQKSWIGK